MRGLLVITVLTLAATCAFADDAELDRLRVDYAAHFFTPEAHLRLAKYLADQGRGLTGFHISEEARLQHFSEEAFARAVRSVYRNEPLDVSPEAERRLCEEIATNPAPPPETFRKLADLHLARGEWRQAEELLLHAIAADPEAYAPVTALAALMRHGGREAEADELETGWLDAHPESLETWRVRAARIVEQDVDGATATIAEALARYPRDPEILFHKAGLLHDQKKLAEAAVEYERAAQLAPRSAYIQGWTARFFLKAMNDRDRALRYYIRAYFLDPEFYDTESVAGRIEALADERAKEFFAKSARSADGIELMLRNPDPVVAGLALQRASSGWYRGYTAAAVALLEHDDPTLRYPAAATLGSLQTRNGDAWLQSVLSGAPADPGKSAFAHLSRTNRTPGLDLYVRSAAAYAAGARFGFRVVTMIEPWLASPLDLMRFDAVSVMAEYGGARGEKRLRRLHESGEAKDERIRAILEGKFGSRK